MDVQKVTQEYRLKKWTEVITECRRSGKTIKSWCQENNINPKSYYYYQKRVRIAACNSLATVSDNTQAIVPLSISDVSSYASTKAKSVSLDSAETAIVLNINSVVIEIRNGASDSTIESTLRAIKNL